MTRNEIEEIFVKLRVANFSDSFTEFCKKTNSDPKTQETRDRYRAFCQMANALVEFTPADVANYIDKSNLATGNKLTETESNRFARSVMEHLDCIYAILVRELNGLDVKKTTQYKLALINIAKLLVQELRITR